MATGSTRMRQWWVVPGRNGGEVALRTVDRPAPGPGQLLIAVAAAGVNRGEIIARAGLREANATARPYPSGIEYAGTVAAVGEAVSGWQVGDRVMGRASACHAEYVAVDAEGVMATPAHLDDAMASAIPNVFVTAHDAIVTTAQLTPGDAVLVSAAASGVGTAALQIARWLGIERIVATTRSASKTGALRDLGATEVVLTTEDGWDEVLCQRTGRVDVVIDQVGGSLFAPLLRCLAVSGRYVSVGRNDGPDALIDLNLLALNRLTLHGVTFRTRTSAESLACSRRFADDLLPDFEPGARARPPLAPVLDRTFDLDELAQAHSYMLGDTQVGKVVLTV